MQSQYPVVEAVLIGTRAIVFVLFCRISQASSDLRKAPRRDDRRWQCSCQAGFSWVSRYGVPMFSRNSFQRVECIVRNTSTTLGSNWDPEQRWISSCAYWIDKALRYGRSEIMASRASATAKILAPRGI